MLRTTYIVKSRLQLKYVLIALIVVGVTAAAVYYTFWSSLIRSAGLEQLSAGEWRALERAYQTNFVWVVLILAIAIGLESIFLFHRLFGPVFVFERTLKRLAEGDLTVSVRLRKNDELKDMAFQLQAAINNVRQAVREDRRKAAAAARKIDEGDLSRAKDEIASVGSWFKIE